MANERQKSNWTFVRLCSRLIHIFYMAIVTIFMLVFYQKAQDESKKCQQAHQELLRIRRKVASQDGSDDNNCSICLTNPLEILLKPCGHICICDQCSVKLNVTLPKCPICREVVTSSERVYIS